MRGMTMSISRWSSGNGSSLIRPRVAPIEEALDAARFGAPHLVGNAAEILADRWPADAPPPFKVDAAAGARHRLGGVARRRGQSGRPRRRGRFICARPTPSRQAIALQNAAQPPAS